MKKLAFLFALAALTALPAHADSNFGVKLGQLSIDGDSGAATQAGLVYTWDLVGMFGVEGELTTSLAKGDFSGVDYGVTSAGVYGVLMTPGAVYFKAKAGMVYSSVDFPGADSSTDAGYGVGVGFEMLGFVWELEYTQIKADAGDADFLSFSMKF
jgi:hypothetical protein